MAAHRFEGKVVVITGGNSGIGLASAKAFLAEGAEVVITGRNPETLAAAATSLGARATALRADVSRLGDIQAVMDAVAARHGRIDVLFANAGLGRFGPIATLTEAMFDEMVGANVKGLFFTVQKALPLMSKGGAIVLCGSVSAVKGVPGSSVYSASKAAVRSLGRSLGAELVSSGIRVNVVSPGPVETPMFDNMDLTPEAAVRMKREWTAGNPMRRFAEAGEIARGVLFLASAEASYMTGADLAVDGGLGSF
jgi:NAD(P)-dependent dehydrogenase (short-subunit alcohol dehydrogenase family)